MNRFRMKGFTLVELLIVVAIVALLAVIAVPSYRSYVLRSHRVEAASALLALSAAQEKFYLQNNTYTDKLSDAPPAGLGLQAVTQNGFYDITISSANAAGFVATATAKGGQLDDTRCKTFTVDARGAKTAKTSSNAVVTDCWSR